MEEIKPKKKTKRKTRKQKEMEYAIKYKDIPLDYTERLNWLYDEYNINENKEIEIMSKRNEMINTLYYKSFKIVLYEEPEGSVRPKFRSVKSAGKSPFVHVYVLGAKEDSKFMRRVVGEELEEIDNLIYTPCVIEYNTYFKTPNTFNTTDTFLAEIGLIRPITKPDWDNMGKKYSDMMNGNLWLDDAFITSATVNKFYSKLPRIEITIRFLNKLYNKYQYNTVSKRKDVNFDIDYFDY